MNRPVERGTGSLLVPLSVVCCFLFGILLLLQVQTAGDGNWFWYSRLYLEGQHLYADLHLPLQPLYVLMTAAGMKVFGTGWLVSKIVPAALLLLYLILLAKLVKRIDVPNSVRAVLIVTCFSLPMLFEAYRLDDYHALADSFELASIYVLLRSSQKETRRAPTPILLGMFAALSTLTRLNDGALLTFSVLLYLLLQVGTGRLKTISLFLASWALTGLTVLLLTGDSITAWVQNSILRASGAKGGLSHLLFYPIALFWSPVGYVYDSSASRTSLFFVACIVLTCSIAVRLKFRKVSVGVLALSGALLSTGVVLRKYWLAPEAIPQAFCAVMVEVALVTMCIIVARLVRRMRSHSGLARPELLLCIPFLQLLSGALSSGGQFLSLTGPIGVFLVLLPIAFPRVFRTPRVVYAYAAVLGSMCAACLLYKTYQPFRWHTYSSPTLFQSRRWYHHPIYGPMVIEDSLLDLVTPVCTQLERAPGSELLSLPFPYANYFCGVRPWHNNVQTFFDTSTVQMIRTLQAQLAERPPHFILYQRQMGNLRGHELLYMHGGRLPHRDLDEQIGRNLGEGKWTTLRQLCVDSSDWVFIATVPLAGPHPEGQSHLHWSRSHCFSSGDDPNEVMVR